VLVATFHGFLGGPSHHAMAAGKSTKEHVLLGRTERAGRALLRLPLPSRHGTGEHRPIVIVTYGNSMGGLESLLTLAERRIPCILASLVTVPVTNLAASHADAVSTTTIRTAYGMASDGSDYAAKTSGHDPLLMKGWQFRGLPT
jgi:hypothetical protein